MHGAVTSYALINHFSGGTPIASPWQSYAWVIEIHEEFIGPLQSEIKAARKAYRQDSVAVIIGNTDMV